MKYLAYSDGLPKVIHRDGISKLPQTQVIELQRWNYAENQFPTGIAY